MPLNILKLETATLFSNFQQPRIITIFTNQLLVGLIRLYEFNDSAFLLSIGFHTSITEVIFSKSITYHTAKRLRKRRSGRLSGTQSRYSVTYFNICLCSSTYLLPSSSHRSPPTAGAGSGPYKPLSFWPVFSQRHARTR